MSSPQPGPQSPPPGWYPDAYGVTRWWDGAQWGVAAPASSPAGTVQFDGKVLAVLAHVSAFFFALIAPIIILVTQGQKSAFVAHHAREALNFHITFFIVWFAGGLLTFPLAIVTAGIALVVMIPLLLTAFVLFVVWSILGAVHANKGEWWKYPWSFRFVK